MKNINLVLTVDSNVAVNINFNQEEGVNIQADASILRIIKAAMPLIKAVHSLMETFNSIMEREVSIIEKEGLSGELETLDVTELI